MSEAKIIVLDDDPTGSQTVHSCLLLTCWDKATLREAIIDASPLFFVLTNTRGMVAAGGRGNHPRGLPQPEVGAGGAAERADMKSIRSWSAVRTPRLRGHYPVETDVIAEELGPFDAHFLVPAFFEGGRVTRGSVHYLKLYRGRTAGA